MYSDEHQLQHALSVQSVQHDSTNDRSRIATKNMQKLQSKQTRSKKSL